MFHLKIEQKSGANSPHAMSQEELPFDSGNPFVEVTKGKLHLFRKTWAETAKTSDAQLTVSSNETILPELRSTLICVLAVPSYMTISDFFQISWLRHTKEQVLKYRIIRESSQNHCYGVIMEFKSTDFADQFYLKSQGQLFTTLSEERARLVFLADPPDIVDAPKGRTGSSTDSGRSSAHSNPVPSDLTELPSCPVCLERLDQSVVTILCNHSFHSDCLSAWKDSTCPVCRYCQHVDMHTHTICQVCGTGATIEPTATGESSSLWICLVCAFVGCGRYAGGHAHAHYQESGHIFALDIETQRVWDYTHEKYVHRLVQNKVDGKVVEVDAPCGVDTMDDMESKKMHLMQMEYQQILTSQLGTQRTYFEKKIKDQEDSSAQQIVSLDEQIKNMQQVLRGKNEEIESLTNQLRSKTALLENAQTANEKMKQDLSFFKELEASSSKTIKEWRDRARKTEQTMTQYQQSSQLKIQDLEEQLRDLAFALEAGGVIAQTPEAQGGQIGVVEDDSAPRNNHRRKNKGKMPQVTPETVRDDPIGEESVTLDSQAEDQSHVPLQGRGNDSTADAVVTPEPPAGGTSKMSAKKKKMRHGKKGKRR